MANLDIIEREHLVERVRELTPFLAGLVEERWGDLPLVGAVRHAGLLAGVEFSPEALEATPGLADRANIAARAEGVVTRGLRGVGLQLSPAFVVTEEELEGMVDGIAAGIRSVAATATV
jgi:L-2,4-diaminobutyrate transaminase